MIVDWWVGERCSDYCLIMLHTWDVFNDLCCSCYAYSLFLGRGAYNRIDESPICRRYPYEYEGGHIRGAINLYTMDAIHSHLLAGRQAAKPPPLTADAAERRHVLIFHCEFSSKRGPSMYRFLREQDRKLNKQTYPALIHPEVYLLEGGYKEFYEVFSATENRCEPCSYKPMNKEGHESDLKHFRAKSKSWAGDSRARGVSKRMFL